MVTIKDIAKIAGVSHATVSRALNDSNEISLKTKEKIKKIADELGFVYNVNAKRLNQNKTNTIGLVTPKFFGEIKSEIFFASLIGKTIETLKLKDYKTYIEIFENENEIITLIKSRQIDALIFVEKEISNNLIKFMNKNNFPFIFLHYLPEKINNFNLINYVRTDHFYGGYIATKHLIENGYKNILTITANKGISIEYTERTEGYLQAIKENNLKSFIFYNDLNFHSTFDLINENIDYIKNNNIDAIFAQTDIMALGVIKALKYFNIKVPKNIGVIGYDNIELGEFFAPTLTTVEQPIDKIIIKGIEILFKNINNKTNNKITNILIKPTLILRDST
jgi:LacI family transcriptional regulator